ncbi:glycerophosphodiester phosphodiesterase [Bacillus cihuensis]|uniref:glycerophosphodiester phosphodiesterase n=1 Tax=Bacillus cihuensis TaxID=1208599 RepID=UPI000409C05C|nr:glycerophosphodiester phosphodiesterase [Bacillus cihuensis]
MKWIFLLFQSWFFRKKQKLPSTHIPLKIGHRGACGHSPENTMASFKKALEYQVDFIEIDIHLSFDGQIVVIHDLTLDRTTNGKGRVQDFTYEELSKLDAGSWYSEGFSGERIPLLSTVLDQTLPFSGVLIEIKHPEHYPEIESILAKELKNRLRASHESPKIMVQSFNIASIKKFHKLLPEVPVGILFKHTPAGISNRSLLKYSQFASFINPKKTMVNERLIRKIHTYGMMAFTWTVNNRKHVHSFEKMKLDGITTDFPDYFSLNEKKSGPDA